MDSDLVGQISSLEKKLANLKSKTGELQNRCSDLKAENGLLEEALRSQTEELKQISVLHPGTRIFEHPSIKARAVVTAERDDVFEVSDERSGWIKVKLDSDSDGGWVPVDSTRVAAKASDPTALTVALRQKPKPYIITRQAVTPFLGDWPSLRGQKALFLWAQPVGIAQREPSEKLQYVKQAFADGYRDALHADNTYSGLVIIFVGGDRTGVAAARLDDIGQWLNGRMPEPEFLKRCSLDPPDVFRLAHK
jgi:hypothetical protein